MPRIAKVFQSGNLPQQEEETGGDHSCACEPGNEEARRHNLFREHQERKPGDPQYIHYATNEEERHQHPAAAHTIEPVLGAKPQRPRRVETEPAMTIRKPSGDWHCVRQVFLNGDHW